MTYTTHTAEETKRVAAEVAHMLHGGEFISLIGDLGAGKTTFTQGLVAAFGSPARVTSPTFSVMNEYPVREHPTVKKVIHCDFYRFTKASEIFALELEDYRGPETIILAEWPNVLENLAWTPDLTITMTHVGGDERTIEVREG